MIKVIADHLHFPGKADITRNKIARFWSYAVTANIGAPKHRNVKNNK